MKGFFIRIGPEHSSSKTCATSMPMYYSRYFDFIRNLLRKPGDDRQSGDMADRFTGADAEYRYSFDTDLERRFLLLSSVKYLISPGEISPTAVSAEIFDQHREENLWGFGLETFEVGKHKFSAGTFLGILHPAGFPTKRK